MTRNRIASLKYAISGIVFCLRNEVNFRLQLVAAVLVIVGGVVLRLGADEWLCITACIAGVLAAEAFNTAVEKLCNLYSVEHNPQVKIIKDAAAGAVLIVAGASIVVGCVIFIPNIILFIQKL